MYFYDKDCFQADGSRTFFEIVAFFISFIGLSNAAFYEEFLGETNSLTLFADNFDGDTFVIVSSFYYF